jgi:hypothetical protein
MTIEEKAQKVLLLVTEIVEEVRERDDSLGGIMRTFGDDYIRRMKTFSKFFKGIK